VHTRPSHPPSLPPSSVTPSSSPATAPSLETLLSASEQPLPSGTAGSPPPPESSRSPRALALLTGLLAVSDGWGCSEADDSAFSDGAVAGGEEGGNRAKGAERDTSRGLLAVPDETVAGDEEGGIRAKGAERDTSRGLLAVSDGRGCSEAPPSLPPSLPPYLPTYLPTSLPPPSLQTS